MSGNPSGLRRSDPRTWLIAAAVVLPILGLIIALAQRNWYPTGDLAQAEMRMRSMPGNPPLLGAAGRIMDSAGRQGNHPGPLMFWVTWPLYVLFGRSSWAFEAATALVNMAWLTVAVLLVRRRTNVQLTAWFGAVLLVLVGGFGLNGLSQPWNPWVALFPFLVLVLAVWSTFGGDRWAPALAVGAGSYALQSHIGYGPMVAPFVLAALAVPIGQWVIARRRSEANDSDIAADATHFPALTLLVAGGVGLACWVGPLIDVVTNQPNNVEKLVSNFGTPSEPPIGLAEAAKVLLQSSNPFGAWTKGGDLLTGSVLPGALFLLAWAVAATAVALRRRARSQTVLNGLLAAATVFGVLTLSRVFGTVFLYTFRWVTVVVALQVFALGWALLTLLPPPPMVLRRQFSVIAAVVLLALSAFTTQRIVGQEIPYDQSWRIEQALAPQAARELDPDRRYLVTWDDTAYLGGIGFGLLLDLERRGFDVGAEPRFAAAVEPQRVRCPGTYDAVITAVTGRARLDAWDANPDARRLASVDLRADPTEYDRYLGELRSEFAQRGESVSVEEAEARFPLILLAPGQPKPIVDLAEELVSEGIPSAVFVTDPAPPSDLNLSNPVNEVCRP